MFDERQQKVFEFAKNRYLDLKNYILSNFLILDTNWKKEESARKEVLSALFDIEMTKIILSVALCAKYTPTEEEKRFIHIFVDTDYKTMNRFLFRELRADF